jgi:uncharacterized coiled-coil protein SlyX
MASQELTLREALLAVTYLEERIAERDKRIAELEKRIAELEVRIADLRISLRHIATMTAFYEGSSAELRSAVEGEVRKALEIGR